MSAPSVVIVGAGAAGTAAASQLRKLGFDGDLTLVHGEGQVPYNRTTVNKTLLQAGTTLDSVRTVLPNDPRTSLLSCRAERLDTERRTVVLQDGTHLSYNAVLIATGARPRLLPGRKQNLHAAELSDRTTPLRTYDDTERVRQVLATIGSKHGRSARVGIVGASLLGSETADALKGLGHDVFLIGAAANPMTRHLGTTIAAWVQMRHEEQLAGVFEARVDAFDASSDGITLALSDGTKLTVDLVIEALGVDPEVDWLRDSPLTLDDGVLVDERLRTVNAAGGYAAGDLARISGSPRIEHWGHALAQGGHAARSISHDLQLTEDPGPFAPSGSYSTWLYGKPLNVLGSPHPHRDREIDLAPTGNEARVTLYTSTELRVTAAITLGSAKVGQPTTAPRCRRSADQGSRRRGVHHPQGANV
ncbi:NAD(P)/FAD-dependent oxidoreductase [Microbacterium sp.]|uniref:NAD(P)/FAD-dependent oxidoreductase n=1 Tax=Microbacterium sp. TaxID=51671 RepID=UPI002732377E|nr:NAD(P)/FAD-dependent oxidoreductase [Microbacterium sp.]MDP3951121.1 NAD(P)/FAD-dependent oxidoreductase [Microbacterium sp.]